jgi:raffinose/stachyose/melibiose transport system substrate-binding protein
MVEDGEGNPSDILGGCIGFVVGKNAPKEAVDFLKYIACAENQQRIIEVFKFVDIPTIKGAETAITDPYHRILFDEIIKTEYLQSYYDQFLPEPVGDELKESIYKLFAGELTPEEVAANVENLMKLERDKQ